MSDKKSWSGIGEEIRDAVESALKTGNFRDLGDVMVNTGADIVKNVSSAVGQAVSGGSGENYTAKYEKATRERKMAQEERRRAEREAREKAANAKAPFRRVGRISSVLYRVFGGIGTGVSSIFFIISLGSILSGSDVGKAFWSAFLFLAGFVIMLNVGCKQKFRLRRAKKYVELAGHNQYINLEDLALHTNKTRKFILKDIKKMMNAGFFPEGHMDAQESCLMLSDKIYSEYLSLEKQRKIQEREQRAQDLKEAVQKKSEEAPKPEEKAPNSELDAMISEGQDCIRRLRNMNDNIAGEEISAKLFRLENLLKEIFEGLKEHPEQAPQMRKFMNYYLPTTLKLVAAYEEFDDLSSQGEEIREAKTEIEKTLDTINGAFEELLNRMFRETAFDVTTDAQVLQTMLAKEGLTSQKEFEFDKVKR